MEGMFVNNVVSSSIFQVGDVHRINAKSQAFAMQRQLPIFSHDEACMNEAPIFFNEEEPFSLSHSVCVSTHHACPTIDVKNIHIISAAAASVVQLGNSEIIQSESKVRHVRHIINENNDK